MYNSDGRNIKTDSSTFTIGGLLKADFKTSPNAENIIFVSDKAAEKYLYVKGYQKVSVNFKKDANYNEVEKELKTKISKFRSLKLVSYREELEKAKKKNINMTLITYGSVVTYLFFLLARKTLASGMTWSLSISNTLAIWAAVVLICYLAARYVTKKLFTSSIIEDIKVLD